jgi:hypothetical protein
MLLLVQSKALDEVPYKLSGAVTKLASITFLSLAFSYWTIKPWFLTEGKLLLCSSYLPLGVTNWSVIYISTGAINGPGLPVHDAAPSANLRPPTLPLQPRHHPSYMHR